MIDQNVCPVCKNKYANVMTHLLKKDDSEHKNYIQKLDEVIDEYLKNTDLYVFEIIDKILEKDFICTKSHIYVRSKIIEPNRKSRIMSSRRMGNDNPVHKTGVKAKISASVSDRWKEGCYQNRINGMLGITLEKHPSFKIRTNSEKNQLFYRDYLSHFENINQCSRCGLIDDKINIHHIDEDHSNFLVSNLEPLCVKCHMKFHQRSAKKPFMTISKRLSFAAAHRLPHHNGKCENWHGHEWVIDVSIKKRQDPDTHMVMDFKELKETINFCIIDVLDHSVLNDFIEIPTAENLLVWCWEQLMFKGHLKGIDKISIWESSDSCAYITKNDMLSVFIKKIDS